MRSSSRSKFKPHSTQRAAGPLAAIGYALDS
jgi:hypothetical protein